MSADDDNEAVIREWGDVWYVSHRGSSSTTGTFLDAVSWALGDLEPGGDPVTIRWGHPVVDGEQP